MGTQKMADIVN